MAQNPQFDVVVWGATAFSGQPIAHYLYKHYRDTDVRWALAGRNLEKLTALRSQLGEDADSIALITADSNNEDALRALCAQTKVVLTTVGPYAWHGSLLVKICAETGTHYCDLTGEVQWIRQMIDTYEATAQSSGAKIIHCCGFDSIPSDLGVFFLQQQAKAKFGAPLNRIDLYVLELDGAMSGGTAQSLVTVMEQAAKDPEVDAVITHPYSLNPKPLKSSPPQPELTRAEFAEDINQWIAPFLMAAINTRIVQRSNALLDYRYGEDFIYQEIDAMGADGRNQARVAAFAQRMILGALRKAPTRYLLKNFVFPKTGQGPKGKNVDEGSYELLLVGKSSDNRKMSARVKGNAEAGYRSTPKMLAEAALCLAHDISDEVPGGFWTPASLMGEALLARMPRAGVTFEIDETI